MADNKQHYHDKGEQDGAKGEYDPPITLGDTFFPMSKDDLEEDKAYKKGYENARSQKKR